MGSVTHPERAQDTVELAKIAFGDEFLEQNTVITSLINANSPMAWDGTMLGALKVYARNNQACIVTPFILSGAMSPVTVAGTLAQVLAEVLSGVATRSSFGRARRCCSACSRVPCPCSRARRPSARRNRRWCPMRAGAARAAARHSVPHRRLALRLEGRRCPGGL